MPTLNLEEKIQWLVLFELVTLISLDTEKSSHVIQARAFVDYNTLDMAQFVGKTHRTSLNRRSIDMAHDL